MSAVALQSSVPVDLATAPAPLPRDAAFATILVVEDDPVLCEVLCRILTRDGYDVRQAQSAKQARELVEEFRPQLVLLDVGLREGTSLQLARTIHGVSARLPVILLTNSWTKSEDFPRWPAKRLLNKSLGLPDLRWAVAVALNEAQAEPPPSADSWLDTSESTPSGSSHHADNPSALRVAKDHFMRLFQSKSSKVIGASLLGLILVLGFVAANGASRNSAAAGDDKAAASSAASNDKSSTDSIELVADKPHTLFVPTDVRTGLGIRKDGIDQFYVARAPKRMQPLEMSGSTALDPTKLFRIRARFAPSPSSAECVQIGQIAEDPRRSGKPGTVYREIRFGDRVVKGDLLAAFYSVDVGNKKNDLIDAIYQLKLDDNLLKRWETKQAVIPEVQLASQRRQVLGDINAVERAVSMLRAWGINEEDIQAIRKEAEAVKPDEAERRLRLHDRSEFDRWARIEIRAPADGVMIERNVTLNEIVVDNTTILFQIADVDKLFVTANCPEDDLPRLEALHDSTHGLIRWTVRTVGSPPMPGFIDDIGYLIDPNQHTAVVKGFISNKQGRIRGGQFIKAIVDQPPPDDVVEVPIDAVIEDGQQGVVFVVTDAARQQFTMRRVEVTNRFQDTFFVRSKPYEKAEALSDEDKELGMLTKEPLRPGERVIESGVGELKAVVLDRESQAHAKSSEGK